MRPVSDTAFFSHISAYDKELCIALNQEKITSAISSAISRDLGITSSGATK